MQVTETIKYVGVNDHDIDLFEGQYDVRENGMAYNSYVVIGEKVAVADTVDARFVDEWLGNVETALDGRTPDLPCGASYGARPFGWHRCVHGSLS